MENLFVHYGHDHIDMSHSKEINDAVIQHHNSLNKPIAFWGSPMDASYSWKDFCEGELYDTDSLAKKVYFKLKPNARVLVIEQDLDLKQLTNDKYLNAELVYGCKVELRLNWDQIRKDYDAMVIYISHLSEFFIENLNLNTWDVDSATIFNLNMVEEVASI